MFLEIQKEFLLNSSLNIITAKNGVEALHSIDRTRPDLICMDLEMPEMDGVDCCRTLKSRPESAGIPVVMITAKGDEDSLRRCRSAGCDDFLTKPLDRNLFLKTAARFVPDIDRREKRRSINLPGFFRWRGTTLPCLLCDLSIGGAFVATDSEGDADRMVMISFTLPDGASIACQGKIIWQKRSHAGAPLGFGINFVLLPRSTKDALNSFLGTEAFEPLGSRGITVPGAAVGCHTDIDGTAGTKAATPGR